MVPSGKTIGWPYPYADVRQLSPIQDVLSLRLTLEIGHIDPASTRESKIHHLLPSDHSPAWQQQNVMAEPFTIIGIASSIVQLVDFSSKLISESREIYLSANGISSAHAELELISIDLKCLSDKLSAQISAQSSKILASSPSDDEVRLHQLASSCHEISCEILAVLQDVKAKHPHHRWQSFRQAVKGVWNREKIQDLERRLDRVRGEVLLHLVTIMRSVNTLNHQSSPYSFIY